MNEKQAKKERKRERGCIMSNKSNEKIYMQKEADAKPVANEVSESSTHYVKELYLLSLSEEGRNAVQDFANENAKKEIQPNVDLLCRAIKDANGCIMMESGCWYWQKLDALFPGPDFQIPRFYNYPCYLNYSKSEFKSFMEGSRPLLYGEATAIQQANMQKYLSFLKVGENSYIDYIPYLNDNSVNELKRGASIDTLSCDKRLSTDSGSVKVCSYVCTKNYSSGSHYDRYFSSCCNCSNDSFYYLPIYRLDGKLAVPESVTEIDVIKSWLKHRMYPKDQSLKAALEFLEKQSGNFELDKEGKVQITKPAPADMSISAVRKVPVVSEVECRNLKAKLLNCDKERAALDPYEEEMLTDIGRGHWELWEKRQDGAVSIPLKEDEYLVARNPKADIYDGVVAIDFGTKSTVVVRLEKNDSINPMRVGLGNLSKKAEAKHYENPTVMEFTDLDSFLSAYNQRQGRPFTKWNDLTISHAAANSLLDSQSTDYHAFVSELKQWAGDRKKVLAIQDKKKPDIRTVKPFCELKDGDLNPIEYYAYLLGLNINNMYQGVHLEYMLSFPVTYEENIRSRILESFIKGLRKSLPQSLLEDAEVMENFSVFARASEPAAYAICALKEFGFNPEPGERIAFSVFDFGGGTTDFDYGIWRAASDDRSERKYDNVIEHYGAGGDSRLGGENILERLAYETFVLNEDKMRSLDASFVCPSNCNPPAGFEKLVNNSSQEARLNTKFLMEKLRDFWERRDGYEKMFDGKSEVVLDNIFDSKGNPKANQSLAVSKERLEQVERELIRNGVDQFFYKMQQTFDKDALIKGISSINIFLAGNSCKSKVLRELFDAKIEEENKKIKEKHPDQEYPDSFYCLYPPLGSDEATKIQEERGCVSEHSVQPTGKTGVAFGLIHCRPGSSVKVIDKSLDEGGEIDFRYFLGYARRGILKCLLSPDIKYGEWKLLYEAEERFFEVYYTTLAAAGTGNLSIKTEGVIRKRLPIQPDPDACIFLRAVSPTKIEYMVATEGENEMPGEVRQKPKTVDLEER